MALRAELGVDHGDNDVDVGDAAVGDPCLGAVEHPFVFGFVVLGAEAIAANVGPGVGFRGAECAELHVFLIAVALRHPFKDLLLGARCGDARGGEARAHDCEADTSVAPEEFFGGDGACEPGRVFEHDLGQELPAIETDLRRFLNDWVRELFALVPLFGGWTNDVLGKSVNPFLELEDVFV